MNHRFHFFDQHLKADASWSFQTPLDLREEYIDPPDIPRRLHFRDNEDVEILADFFNDGDNVLVGVLRLQIVNADGPRLLSPIQCCQSLYDLCPGSFFLIGSNGILKVKKYQVGIARGGFLYL